MKGYRSGFGSVVLAWSREIRFRALTLPLSLLLGLAASPATLGQGETYLGEKSFAIPRLETVPVLDGRPDEALWMQAALVDDFHQVDPAEYAEPSEHTEVRVFFTRDALYIAARMEDDPDAISALTLRQGQGLGSDDIFVVILDPYLDRRSGYQFEVNPNGLRVEGLFQNVDEVERNWSGIWETEAFVDENGWSVEMKIPFQTISFDPDGDRWGINFKRTIRRRSENIAWVSRNRQINPGVAGSMHGLSDLEQGIGLDIVPSMVVRQERIIGPDGSTDHNLEPQLDVFYKVTPQLNAALTLNTDFSATEVDDRQVNLTRFSLFFPEKRDFFTRDADIFEFGQIGTSGFNRNGGGGNPAVPAAAAQNGRPFFSRRIGLSPTGSPVDINAGAKLSGRIGDWNVGTLVVSQQEDDTSGVDASNVFVARAALNVLAESQLGVIVTDGDPQSNLDNSLLGMDFNYRNSRLPGNRLLQGSMWYQQSDTEGVSGRDDAWGVGLSSPNSTGWRGGFNYKRIGENFDPALGFVSQSGIEDTAIDAGYRHFFTPGGYFRSIYMGFDGYRSSLLEDGSVSSESKGLRITGNNNAGDGMFVRLLQNREVLQSPFTLYRSSDGSSSVTLPAGDYRFDEGLIGLDLGNQRKVSGRYTIRWGEYYDGNRVQRNADVSLRTGRHLSLSIGYNENEIHLPAGNFTVRLFTFNTNIAFNAKLSWNNLIQYDNVSETLGFNSRLHWIPKAGQQAFLVFNYGMQDIDRDNHFNSTSSDLSLKFNYTFRY